MNSYQVCDGENSSLFTESYRPREVKIRYFDQITELRAGKGDNFEVGAEFSTQNRYSDTFSNANVETGTLTQLPVYTNSTRPPLSLSPGFSTPPACVHYSRLPSYLRAQGQDFPGLVHSSYINNTGIEVHSEFGPINAQIQIYSHDGPKIHFAVVDSRPTSNSDPKCKIADLNHRNKTFEWMKVKRSQPRTGTFLGVYYTKIL